MLHIKSLLKYNFYLFLVLTIFIICLYFNFKLLDKDPIISNFVYLY